MSALVVTTVTVTCDGPRMGLDCRTGRASAEDSLTGLRAALRREGWTWPHHEDRRVDLCPSCTPRATLVPPYRPGRPPRPRLAA